MIVKPKIRNFLCLTAHPDGCAESVRRQIDYVRSRPSVEGAKRVLVIGSSTGYGLASRIACAFGCGADTVGVMFENRPPASAPQAPVFTTIGHSKMRRKRPDCWRRQLTATHIPTK